MAITACQPRGSCKAVPGRCYNRNRPQVSLTLATAHASLLLLITLASSCLALPLDATTYTPTDLERPTTVIPIETSPKPTIPAINETILGNAPIMSAVAEAADDFVPIGGEGLEQGIRDAVKSEVESEIDADSSVRVETLPEINAEKEQQPVIDDKDEQAVAAQQGVREPKTLESEAELEAEKKADQSTIEAINNNGSEAETDSTAINSEQVVERQENSDIVAGSFDENHAITEQTIAKTNLFALEKEAAILTAAEATPKPTYEVTKHQVTKKQGVQDLLPIELPDKEEAEKQDVAEPVSAQALDSESDSQREAESESKSEPAVVQEPVEQGTENNREQDKLNEVESASESSAHLNAIEENIIESEDKDKQIHVVASSELKDKQVDSEAISETQEKLTKPEVLGEYEGKQVKTVEVDKQLQAAAAGEDENKQIQSVAASEDEDNDMLSQRSISAAPEQVQELTEPYLNAAVPVEPAEGRPYLNAAVPVEPAEGRLNEQVVKAIEPVVNVAAGTEKETLTPTEANKDQSEVDAAKVEQEASTESDASESVQLGESSSTAFPAEVKSAKDSSAEDDSDDENDKSDNSAAKDSSEESGELTAIEPLSKAEDSTATPLVSYPPHNAGQTFYSNLADEHSAHLSLTSTNRSTLIIALCSGTAVVFIVISLVIFLLSFQRQHGTLDIEMQEQRLGKDNLDEEDAQLKLLDVDLSTPVIVAMGNEETDECL